MPTKLNLRSSKGGPRNTSMKANLVKNIYVRGLKNKTAGYNCTSTESGTHINILLIKPQQGRRKQFSADT